MTFPSLDLKYLGHNNPLGSLFKRQGGRMSRSEDLIQNLALDPGIPTLHKLPIVAGAGDFDIFRVIETEGKSSVSQVCP